MTKGATGKRLYAKELEKKLACDLHLRERTMTCACRDAGGYSNSTLACSSSSDCSSISSILLGGHVYRDAD